MTNYSRSFEGLPTVDAGLPNGLFEEPRSGLSASAYASGGKRALDILLVSLAAPTWLTIIVLSALAILVFDRQAPFFSQIRVGRGRRIFRMWKLRTMLTHGDAVLKEYFEQNPEARAEWEVTQKLKSDPRITTVGRFLRKTSLDELPQLFNVLMGDMSLVGPRPFMASQQKLYLGNHYYMMRPGLTGLWQVRARNGSSFARRVLYDNHYYRAQRLKTDLQIMLQTVGVVARGTGH